MHSFVGILVAERAGDIFASKHYDAINSGGADLPERRVGEHLKVSSHVGSFHGFTESHLVWIFAVSHGKS